MSLLSAADVIWCMMKKQAQEDMTVEAATLRDLQDLARRLPGVDQSSMAASALALARGIDARPSLAMTSMAAKELRETMAAISALVPASEELDAIDELAKRRASRRAAG